MSHKTWLSSAPPVFDFFVIAPHVGWICSRFGGALPCGSVFPAKQFCGWPALKAICPKSLLLGLPK